MNAPLDTSFSLFLPALAPVGAGDLVLTMAALALLAGCVAALALRLWPRQTLQHLARLLTHTLYRVDACGLAAVPRTGGVLLAPNHVSLFDAVLITALSPRPVRFVMDAGIFRHPLLNPVFRAMGCIPIAPARRSPALLAEAHERIAEALEAQEAVCIFPEGALTRDGQLAPFRRGIERIVERTPVPVVPVAMDGLWGSIFSRAKRDLVRLLKRGPRPRLNVTSASPLPPQAVRARSLHQIVSAMLANKNTAVA